MPCGACFLFKRLLREAPLRLMLNGPGSNGTSRDYGLKNFLIWKTAYACDQY